MNHKKIAIMVTLFITILVCGCNNNNPITEFSTKNWSSVEWNQRYHMLEDLYLEVELVGMTSDEIEELLGTYSIECEAYWSDEGRCDYHWGYAVRNDWWYGDEYLLISFKDDVVVGYELEYGSDL